MELNVVVAWDAGQKNLVGFRVDSDNHVDVASGDGGNVAIGVDAADIDVERILGDVDIRGSVALYFSLDRNGI